MDTFHATINWFDPELKDAINDLTLEAFKDTQMRCDLCYQHDDLYFLLATYYPSFDLRRTARFDLHPMYFKYIQNILCDETHINNISQNIKDFFAQHPEEIWKIEIFVEKYWLKFWIRPASSVTSMGCDGKIYWFHNLDSARQQWIFEKVFKIYITYVYNTILKMIKWKIEIPDKKRRYIPVITINLNWNNG